MFDVIVDHSRMTTCGFLSSFTMLPSRQLLVRLPRAVLCSRSTSSSSVVEKTTSTPTQAPNYPTTWSTNQRPRPSHAENPRFEQANMELQPNPLSAMEMINAEPIRMVHGRKAVCDGGKSFSFFGG